MNRDNLDTTINIWEYYFKVRVPFLQSRSINDIKMYGVDQTGIKAFDDDVKNQWLTTYITISKMVDYFKEGIAIKVVDYKDIELIYKFISNHIYAWKNLLERGINIGNAPIDDLIAMDQFANSVYDHAKYQFTSEIANSIIGQYMSDIQRVNASNFFKPTVMKNLSSNVSIDENGNTRINKQEDDLPNRESLTDFFKEKLIGIRRY